MAQANSQSTTHTAETHLAGDGLASLAAVPAPPAVAVSDAEAADPSADRWLTPGGIPVSFRVEPFISGRRTTDPRDLWLHQEHARLSLLRGFDELL